MYVANEGSQKDPVGSISGFTVDPASGALKSLPGSPFAGDDSPNVIASDPLGHFVFVGEAGQPVGIRGSNCDGTNSVLLSERVDATSGALTLADRKVLTGDCVSSIAVDPTGTNVYVGMESTGATPGAIQGFIISPSGTLTEIAGSPFPVNSTPLGLAMHPSGKFVYGASSSGLQILDRNTTTGMLTLRGTVNTPKQQLSLNPAGTFLAASELNSNGVSQFNVDPTTGDVTAVLTDQNVPVNSPGAIAADPLGSFFAVTEISDPSTHIGGISTLSLTNTGGTQLVKTTGSPFVSGHVPDGVAFDPAGTFVYVADSNDGNIAGFRLDRSTGKLTPIAGSPFASATFPVSLTIVRPH